MSVVWRAIGRSFLCGFIIVAVFLGLYSYEFWFLDPGQGYLSSDVAEAVPDKDKMLVFTRSLLFVPVQLLAVSGIFFLAQVPVIVIQLLLWR
jgi:hypothetical protein